MLQYSLKHRVNLVNDRCPILTASRCLPVQATALFETGDLSQENRNRVKNPKSNRTDRTFLKKMQRYNLVIAEGSRQDRLSRCVESKEVS